MKVKDIISEGFARGFVRGLMPKALKPVFGKDALPADMYRDAKKAYELFGVGPDYDEEYVQALTKNMSPEQAEAIRKKAGEASWLTDFQKMKKQVDIDAALGSEEQYAADTVDRARQAAGVFPRSSYKQGQTPTSAKKTAAPSSTIAAKMKPAVSTTPPPQVTMPDGEIITKYGGSWYNEQGQRVVDAASIASLERRAQKPSGQTQMATTKNIPVDLPGYRGKRK